MTLKKILPVLLVGVALTGCGVGDFLGGKEERPPLKGERIAVLDAQRNLRPDDNAKIGAFAMPDAWANESWPQAGGTPDHATQHLSLSQKALQKLWSADIGDGSKSRLPLTAQPVVAGKSIFTLDSNSALSAFSTEDGKRRWTTNLRKPDEKDAAISGGISYDSGTIYATAGYDEIVAIDAQDGKIKWRAATAAPSRAAPTILGGRVFITTIGNTLLAFNAADGKAEWEFSGMGQTTGLVGAASPAAHGDMVVPAFSSGELYALRTANGSVAWSENLSNSLRLGGISGLSDIRGLPVIDNNVVYAISFGGKMVAVDIRTGARLWQKEISGAKTPAIVGNRVFVISTDAQIVSLDKDTGSVIWVSQLARYKDQVAKSGPILWSGPLFAGERLFAFSNDGRTAEIHPEQGTLVREWKTGKDVRIAPLVAGGTLYILSEDGDLTAYR